MSLPDGFTLRVATPDDAALLARFRAGMVTGFGVALEDGWEACWTAYFAEALTDGRYWALLAEQDGAAVACAALMFLPVVPVPSDPGGVRAQVQGVYTVPEFRGRGLGEALTRKVLREAQRRGLKSATLNAAPLGQGIYARLGFEQVAAPEMRLKLDGWAP
ncbi:GNAT family N-acetyltransferase [Deinococcus ruber]|uniref:GNAT family N-acetyltransferase n=1 Tax=Deinococcus ruber TaxID=1848197 RepID=UPI00166D93D3|nr:GNAT family N-acetyltransferase [Deinococcus ruber]